MRCLHTSDWHLGHRLFDRDRREEHDRFLRWLLKVIREEAIDLFLLSGDVFDTGTPPNYAQKQYYDFLSALPDTGCRQALITGGNHDSVSTLTSSSALLSRFRIHVQAGAAADPAAEVRLVDGSDGRPLAVVCAVPYLRERDLRSAVPGEPWEERESAVGKAVREHFQAVTREALRQRPSPETPLIAMGHLFAAGARVTEDDHPLYVGNLGQVSGDVFPPELSYTALGHLHTAQGVGNNRCIRYSGSPLKLTFAENEEKSVTVLAFEGAALAELKELPVPPFRTLFRLEGTCKQICGQIAERGTRDAGGEEARGEGDRLREWAEVRVKSGADAGELNTRLQELTDGADFDILRIKVLRPAGGTEIREEAGGELLGDLTLEDIFQRRLDAEGEPDEDGQLKRAFSELVLRQREGESA